jgi:hypothetical protein
LQNAGTPRVNNTTKRPQQQTTVHGIDAGRSQQQQNAVGATQEDFNDTGIYNKQKNPRTQQPQCR